MKPILFLFASFFILCNNTPIYAQKEFGFGERGGAGGGYGEKNRLDNRSVVIGHQVYIIKNRKVLNDPYLYPEWNNGVISLQNGNVYNSYQLRYDVLDQKLIFNNGKDSLEIEQPISAFTLVAKKELSDTFYTTQEFRFAKLCGDKKNNRFYEVLYDDEKGTYLKYSFKEFTQSSTSLPNRESNEYLNLRTQHFYFNKLTNTLKRAEELKSNWEELIANTTFNIAAKVNELHLDLLTENDVIALLKNYNTHGATK